MSKLLGSLIGLVIILGLIIFGVNRFVSLDDLAGCGDQPTRAGCAPADAIVAISGGDTSARTDEAVKLYQAGWAKTLIVSGAALDPRGPSNAAAMRRHAIDAGVPASAILTDNLSQDTSGNALGVALVAKEHNLRTIIVVTSPYHQQRASIVFNRAFIDIGTVRNHPTPTDKYWPSTWWTNPTSWYLVASEMIKTIAELTRSKMP